MMQEKERLFEELLQKLEPNFSKEDLDDIQKAYTFADEKHKGFMRLTNEEFITHPLQVALILSDLHVDKKR